MQTVIKYHTDNLEFLNTFSLIHPPISKNSNKITLKVVGKRKSYMRNVGVASKSQLIKSKFDWTPDHKGLFVIDNNGFFSNPDNEKNVKYPFDPESVLELEYLDES